jgi:hypothetical protein
MLARVPREATKQTEVNDPVSPRSSPFPIGILWVSSLLSYADDWYGSLMKRFALPRSRLPCLIFAKICRVIDLLPQHPSQMGKLGKRRLFGSACKVRGRTRVLGVDT